MQDVENDPILRYLWSMVGLPYIWGGQGPNGFDCSGLVIEVLKARGICKSNYDATAHELFIRTMTGGTSKPVKHALAFYGKLDRITHVGYCISSELMIESAGGGSTCIDLASASKLGAFVRLRPIYSRKDFKAIHVPDKKHF